MIIDELQKGDNVAIRGVIRSIGRTGANVGRKLVRIQTVRGTFWVDDNQIVMPIAADLHRVLIDVRRLRDTSDEEAEIAYAYVADRIADVLGLERT